MRPQLLSAGAACDIVQILFPAEDPVQMLSAIREYCTDREKEVIDNIIGFVQMFSTYGTLFSAT